MPEPCPVYGHHAYRAQTCTACRAEFLETGRWPVASQHRDATHTTEPDARMRAAGDTNGEGR